MRKIDLWNLFKGKQTQTAIFNIAFPSHDLNWNKKLFKAVDV